ncbi:MAG: YMGG-like glycine zipper-containing protein [Gammaproteobacteria bacterium]
MKSKISFAGFLVMVLLAGCAYMPTGPSVMVLPGTGMSFEQFRQDDSLCQQFAYGQMGGVTANQAAVDSQVGSAVVGTALGAAAGAALGGGSGAAIGAGSGLVAGTLAGSGEGGRAAYATQEGYDNAYIQCMYAKGHRVPVSGQFIYEDQIQAPNSSIRIPPPPPGTPPPPPYR